MRYRVFYEENEGIIFEIETEENLVKGDYIFDPDDNICKIRKRYFCEDYFDIEVSIEN